MCVINFLDYVLDYTQLAYKMYAHPMFLILISSSSENLVVELHGFSLCEQWLRKRRGSRLSLRQVLSHTQKL